MMVLSPPASELMFTGVRKCYLSDSLVVQLGEQNKKGCDVKKLMVIIRDMSADDWVGVVGVLLACVGAYFVWPTL